MIHKLWDVETNTNKADVDVPELEDVGAPEEISSWVSL